MPILYYIQNSSIGIILISIVLFYVLGQGGRRQAQDSLFVALLVGTLLLITLELAVDLLTGRVFFGSRTLLTITVVLFYMVNPIPGSLYLLYLDQLRKRWSKIPPFIGFIALIPLVAAAILITSSLFNGMIFTIDGNNVYLRGPFFYLIILANLVCMVIGFIYLIIYRDSFLKKRFFLVSVFPCSYPPRGLFTSDV